MCEMKWKMKWSIDIFIFLILVVHDYRSRSSKSSVSTLNEESTNSSLQFHLSITDDTTDDGIVSDADDSLTEDDDQVFRTPVDANSAPSSPATIIAGEGSTSSPLIEVYSVYKDLNQALEHLHKKSIATYAPETMRGGGLLVNLSFSLSLSFHFNINIFLFLEILWSISTELQSSWWNRNVSYATIYVFKIFYWL